MNAPEKSRLGLLVALALGVALFLGLSHLPTDGTAQSPPLAGNVQNGPSGAGKSPGQEKIGSSLADELPPYVMASSPPVAALISVGQPDPDNLVTVTGAPGAVAPKVLVAVSNLETALSHFVQAGDDGSFSASVTAPPGTYVQVKHVHINIPAWEAIGSGGADLMYPWLTGTPGTILPVPLNHSGPEGSLPFGIAGRTSDDREGYWAFTGNLGPEIISGTTSVYAISGTLTVHSEAITAGIDLEAVEALSWFNLRRLFDQNGRQVPLHQQYTSNLMTPTGLPISRETPNWTPIRQQKLVTDWQLAGDHSLQASISLTVVIPAGTEPGLYRPRFGMYTVNVPPGPVDPNLYILRPGLQFGAGYLPLIRVGQPDPPRLTWTLLNDSLYQGTRGAVAREDKDSFNLIPLTVFSADALVVPRLDPRSGLPITYSLEPYLPLVTIADRGLPNPPLIPFVLPGGQVQIEVRKPDGSLDSLGPAPFQQSTNRGPAFSDGQLRDNDGQALHEIYQLITQDEQFTYSFEQDGHHVITVSGSLEDIWGNAYYGSGTFDLLVARPLRLETGQLPTTPYVTNDAFSPGLQIYPPVSATVAIHLTHMVDSDPAQATPHTIVGRANRFGYFQPPAGTQVRFDGPGEYRVDVSALYTDTQGALWMGHATWGNVVQGLNPVLIAHGHRGIDIPHWNNLLWFFHLTQLDLPIIAGHTYYTYYSGDIFWGGETIDYTDTAGDSIAPMLSFQDTGGDIYQFVQQRWDSTIHVLMPPYETLSERLTSHEAPLVSTTSDGADPHWSPDKIDQYAYGYRTSQRPGARVHETVSEEGTVYWRFNANYGDQVGREGDLTNDVKWQFGGAVFRVLSETNPINEYAIYGSFWVLIDGNDPLGPRVTPPFQGTAGGPNGGPIMTLKEKEIDLFFYPRCVQPGDVLEVGDTIAFCGHVGPPLGSTLAVTMTAPDGAVTTLGGQANQVGWYYNPSHDFVADEAGVWTVQVSVTHEQIVPSTGLAPSAHNTGGVLGAPDGRYHFYVVEPGSPRLGVTSPQPGFLTWPGDPITVTQVPIVVPVPNGYTNAALSYTIRMPGFILDQGTLTPAGNTFTILYDPLALHQDYLNLDLTAKEEDRAGLADPVLISFLLSGEGAGGPTHLAGTVFLDGEEVHALQSELSPSHSVYLPVILRR